MLIPELRRFTPKLLSLPSVARVHAASLDALRAAFGAAGFQVDRPIGVALVAPGAPATYWGGFEVRDPASGKMLRVMAGLGYSTIRAPMSTWAGLSLKWDVTRSFQTEVPVPAGQRELLSREIGAHRIAMAKLNLLSEEAVIASFDAAMQGPSFLATSAQAAAFVTDLVDAVAP